ncbi:hypothetical protein THOM_2346 [Trachipleistophora hominis]|uniref:Uncharacterized protein n=1 Tax=Trachipleistophora hominis TaxID=72359 RepID=L7JTT5_TRAHO|nr:hypothetical protein THOM_2346 [Trachipleistophora hominis]
MYFIIKLYLLYETASFLSAVKLLLLDELLVTTSYGYHELVLLYLNDKYTCIRMDQRYFKNRTLFFGVILANMCDMKKEVKKFILSCEPVFENFRKQENDCLSAVINTIDDFTTIMMRKLRYEVKESRENDALRYMKDIFDSTQDTLEYIVKNKSRFEETSLNKLTECMNKVIDDKQMMKDIILSKVHAENLVEEIIKRVEQFKQHIIKLSDQLFSCLEEKGSFEDSS